MALEIGTRLAHYDVTALIGEGGMGQVYQATDTKLNRQVALKILPEAFAADPDRLARFQREAQVLASLNHPGIAAIYGIEEAEGTRALVLELVEGPTLADRISKGPIPLDEALPIAKQIAEALEAAHEAGVIHRDLKPANIKVREDGTVKVLDFGLAKAFQPDASDPSLSQSPTISLTPAATQMGMVIGTAAYMAPEQAKGKVIDKRADVWAFGAVLYEMLTGKKPFVGEDVSDTLAAVLRADVDLGELPAETPLRLRQVLTACLQRDPKQRVHDIADVRLAMEGAFDATEPRIEAASLPGLHPWQRPVPLLLAATLLVLVLVAVAGGWFARSPAPSPITHFEVLTPPSPPLGSTVSHVDAVISPNGQQVVYTANVEGRRHLYSRRFDELEAVPLAGTENGVNPIVSADGEWVAFYDQAELKKVPISGGPPISLCVVEGNLGGATWESDESLIFSTMQAGTGLFRVSAFGGEVEVVTTPNMETGEIDHRLPHALPGRQGVLFTVSRGSTRDVAVVDLQSGAYQVLVPDASTPRYTEPGYLLYGSGDVLYVAGFDAGTLTLTTVAVPVVEGLNTKLTGAVNFTVSDGGSLLYVPGTRAALAAQRSLVWVNETGDEEDVALASRDYSGPRVSPDGRRVAVRVREAQGAESDIWVLDLERHASNRITFDASVSGGIAWSPPDGEWIAYGTRAGLFRKRADGTGVAEALEENQGVHTLGFVPDGSGLVFSEWDRAGDLFQLAIGDEGVGSPTPLITTGIEAGRAPWERNPSISPDGRWLTYDSDETGRREVWVRPFPNVDDGR